MNVVTIYLVAESISNSVEHFTSGGKQCLTELSVSHSSKLPSFQGSTVSGVRSCEQLYKAVPAAVSADPADEISMGTGYDTFEWMTRDVKGVLNSMLSTDSSQVYQEIQNLQL